jgi:glycosyltransferase involved in cell wall biosynthesis
MNESTGPKFSIFIPVVKTRFFKDAVSSALNQSFDDYEIVVLNNAADADTSFVIEHSRVRYFQNAERLPAVKNWNKGIELCRGEFVILLCDDDRLRENCLPELEIFLRRNPDLDVVRFLREEFYEISETPLGFSCPGVEIETLDEFLYFQEKNMRGVALSDFAFRRSIAIKVGGFRDFPTGWGSDRFLVAAIAAERNKIGNLNQFLLLYRSTIGSITDTFGAVEKMEGDYLYFTHIAELLRKIDGSFKNLALEQNMRRLQIQQNSHFIAALQHRRFKVFVNLFMRTKDYPTSRAQSVFVALLRFFKAKR